MADVGDVEYCMDDGASFAGDDMTKAKIELIASHWTLAGNVCPGGPTEVSPHPLKDRTAPCGINVVVEFIPFSSFNTVDLAIELVKDSRPNSVVTIYIRHVGRAKQYGTTKSVVLQMVRAGRLDFGRKQIRVNAVSPGPMATEMFYVAYAGGARSRCFPEAQGRPATLGRSTQARAGCECLHLLPLRRERRDYRYEPPGRWRTYFWF